jgi:hypothetical protein
LNKNKKKRPQQQRDRPDRMPRGQRQDNNGQQRRNNYQGGQGQGPTQPRIDYAAFAPKGGVPKFTPGMGGNFNNRPQIPPIGGNKLVMGTSIPPMMGSRPPMMGNQPPMMGNQPPMMGNQPPMMGNQPPMMGNQPPMMGNQPPMMGVPMMGGNKPPMMGMTPPPMGKPTNILPSNNNINVPPKQ